MALYGRKSVNTDALMKLGLGMGVLYAAYRFAPGGEAVKAAILGVMGVAIAKQTPYIRDLI